MRANIRLDHIVWNGVVTLIDTNVPFVRGDVRVRRTAWRIQVGVVIE